MRRGECLERFDVKFFILGGHQHLSSITANLGSLVAEEPEYGSGSRAVHKIKPSEISYVRITDFSDLGIPEGHDLMTAEEVEMRYLLRPGDVLFARSGATVGKTYLYTGDIGKAIFAGYCIRFRFDNARVLPEFVYFYTKTTRYQTWVKSIQRPSGQPNINKEEFKSFTLPLPPLKIQRTLVADMEAAREMRRRKQAEANALLGELDDWLSEQLNIKLPNVEAQNVYAVRLGEVQQKSRLNADYFHPERVLTIRAMEENHTHLDSFPLSSLVQFIRDSRRAPTGNYIGLAHVQSNTGEIVEANEEVEGGCLAFEENDVLFARLRPYLNKVYRAEFSGVCSPEFYVMRVVNKSRLNTDYLATILRSSLILAQTRHMMTGNTHPRLTNEDVISLVIPFPEIGTQELIANEVHRRRTESRRLRAEAEVEWQAAKERFERQLLAGGKR